MKITSRRCPLPTSKLFTMKYIHLFSNESVKMYRYWIGKFSEIAPLHTLDYYVTFYAIWIIVKMTLVDISAALNESITYGKC